MRRKQKNAKLRAREEAALSLTEASQMVRGPDRPCVVALDQSRPEQGFGELLPPCVAT